MNLDHLDIALRDATAYDVERALERDVLDEAVALLLRPRFASLSIETGTFDLAGFNRLARAGVDGLAIYQETYLPAVYDLVHQAGPKRRGDKRLEAIDLGGRAGFRTLGIGVLLGLGPWRLEACHLAAHARELGRRHWRSRIAVSFPRIQTSARDFVPPNPVSDRDLVQMICAMRLALPDADLVLSTREPAHLRDELIGLGITRMSAGSRTNPGGYVRADGLDESGEQFSVGDQRTPSEIARVLIARDLEPVWKDFDRAFVGSAPSHAP
jgi:2-iminoacetate synthase